jgi:hypothetical protein
MREIQEPAKSPERLKPTLFPDMEPGVTSLRSIEDIAKTMQRTLANVTTKGDTSLVLTTLDDAAEKKAKEAQEAAEKAVKALIADGKTGKWGKDSKDALKRIFDEIKDSGATPEQAHKMLNQVGSLINGKLKEDGSKNTVGLAMATEKGEVTFRMTLNGPKIDKADNVAAILKKKDIDTVYTVGTMKEPKKEKE